MNSTSPSDGFDADVIIVGGGPIGLTTACALAHHGVDCLLIEQRHQPKEWSRANNLWARPQELLASIGVRDAIAAQAYSITQVNTLLNGRTVDPVEIADVASPYGPVLYSGQDVIETTLDGQALAKGARIERGRKMTRFVQDEDGVTLTLVAVSEGDENEAVGPEETLRGRYMIGADGAKGFVRNALGLGFEPEKLPNCMNRQVDAKLNWRRSTEFDHLWFFYYPRGFCGVLPVWGGYHRVFFLADDTGIPDRDPTLEEMQAIAREVTEDDTLTLTDPIWLTHSRFQHGAAAHYAKDRVLLVGDAGHLSLPAGGQGMLASGVVVVQVVTNPLISLLGPARTTHSRLTFAQAFNSLGTVVFPKVGATLILGGLAGVTAAQLSGPALDAYRVAETQVVMKTYIGLAVALAVVAAVVWFNRNRLKGERHQASSIRHSLDLLRQSRFAFGALCIFLYVGAEVSIGSLIVNYMQEPRVLGVDAGTAGSYIPWYWGGAMIGRFIGAALLAKVSPGKVLSANAAGAIVLIAVSVLSHGSLAAWTLLLVGLMNSIMFPTIFSLACEGLGERAADGSGIINVAICGGAVIPLLTGGAADWTGSLAAGLLLPVICYAVIALFGWRARQPVVAR